MPDRFRFVSDYTRALRMEGRSEVLLLLAALFGILAVAYADSLVVTISLGYLYVLPLSLAALTQYRRTAFSLVGLCILDEINKALIFSGQFQHNELQLILPLDLQHD
jgi:hypothetical protein